MSIPTDGRETRQKTGIVIINPYGGIWTDEIFDTPEAALEYLRAFWKEAPMDLKAFKLAMGVQTLTVFREAGEPTFVPWPAKLPV